jgi:hypothetical protein
MKLVNLLKLMRTEKRIFLKIDLWGVILLKEMINLLNNLKKARKKSKYYKNKFQNRIKIKEYKIPWIIESELFKNNFNKKFILKNSLPKRTKSYNKQFRIIKISFINCNKIMIL